MKAPHQTIDRHEMSSLHFLIGSGFVAIFCILLLVGCSLDDPSSGQYNPEIHKTQPKFEVGQIIYLRTDDNPMVIEERDWNCYGNSWIYEVYYTNRLGEVKWACDLKEVLLTSEKPEVKAKPPVESLGTP